MFNLSPMELAIIAVIVVLLFGTRKLPELGSGLGKAISNFRKSFKEEGGTPAVEDKPAEQKNQSNTQ